MLFFYRVMKSQVYRRSVRAIVENPGPGLALSEVTYDGPRSFLY